VEEEVKKVKSTSSKFYNIFSETYSKVGAIDMSQLDRTFITLTDYAKMYHITRQAVHQLFRRGEIRGVRVSRPEWKRVRIYLDPKSGSKNTMFVQYAGGALGGDPQFIKSVADSAWYYPLFWDTVVMARGRIGYAATLNDLPVPTGEKFFVGGAGSVRGYRYGTVSPLEVAPDGSVLRVGGTKELIINFEFNFPIVPAARLKGLLFYDMGRGFSDTEPIRTGQLRHSYGWGFWWLSPMGPLRFEWGYIINRQPEDQRSAFEFSIGAQF